MYRTLDTLAKTKGLRMMARKIIDALTTIKSGDIILLLLDGRELRLRRVSRPDPLRPSCSPNLAWSCPSASGRIHARPPM